jgi:hypothetical protein
MNPLYNSSKFNKKIIIALTLIFSVFTSFSQCNLKTEKCFIISDIHFDPLFGNHKDTSLYNKMVNTPITKWSELFENQTQQNFISSSLLGKDANYAIFKSALINMSKRLPAPKFIIIAGDFIWHGAKPQDSILKKKTMSFIAGLFNNYFPNTIIIPVLGNNDTYGEDYQLQNSTYLSDFTEAWNLNLPKNVAPQLKSKGYYTYKIGELKLLVLNSAPVSYNSDYNKQAIDMLEWLKNNLADAKTKNVWIVSHIPPGLNGYNNKDMWNVEQKQTYIYTVLKYAKKMRLGIASHTHFNEFKVFYNSKNQPKAFMRIIPSICSNHGNNPSFEIADFNKSNGTLVNETNYVLNLASIPNKTSYKEVSWNKILIITNLLDNHKINASNLSKLITKVKIISDTETLSNYLKFYTLNTEINSKKTINLENLSNYLKADSLK